MVFKRQSGQGVGLHVMHAWMHGYERSSVALRCADGCCTISID